LAKKTSKDQCLAQTTARSSSANDLGERNRDMGGYGSGFQGIKKGIVEDCLILSITDLFRQKVLVDGSLFSGVLRLSLGDGLQPDAAMWIEADLRDELHATIQLRYLADGEAVRTWIWPTTTTPSFGGRRWWFKCPVTNRRVAKLYLPPGESRFASREAYGLSYRSCQQHVSTRGQHQRIDMEVLNTEPLGLQFLLDSAMYEAFADYDVTQSIRTQAIAVFDSSAKKSVALPSSSGVQQLRTMLNNVVRAIEATGAPEGYGVVHMTEQGHELAFLTAFIETDKAVCALKVERGTGDPMRDLHLVTNISNGSDFTVLDPSGREDDELRCEIDLQIPHQLFS
jgi:hypothetical protein